MIDYICCFLATLIPNRITYFCGVMIYDRFNPNRRYTDVEMTEALYHWKSTVMGEVVDGD